MRKKITKRQHKAMLLESTIDNTPMEIVASFHDATYMRMKAVELIMSARDDEVRQAICLLALARCEVQNDSTEKAKS